MTRRLLWLEVCSMRIPREIFDIVASYLDQPTLQRFSLCTKRYKRHIHRMPTRIEIHTVAQLVEAMKLVNLESIIAGYEAFSKRSRQRLRGLIQRCPRIKHFDVTGVPDAESNFLEALPEKIQTLEYSADRLNRKFAPSLARFSHLTSLVIHTSEARMAAEIQPFKNHPTLTHTELVIWRLNRNCDLDWILSLAPVKVGANLIIANRTALTDCLLEQPFKLEKAQAIIKAGANPNLMLDNGLRPLLFCKTTQAADFLLQECKVPINFSTTPKKPTRTYQSTASVSQLFACVPVDVALQIIFSPVADEYVANGVSLVPEGCLVPDEVAILVGGTRGKGQIFKHFGEKKVQERLQFEVAALMSDVSYYIGYCRMYPSH